jgi:7,8-dihydropterin-6-yl-methyl-4-(beta-D-ribofuranosyl)aminobenzene 5'-phosphate synthase
MDLEDLSRRDVLRLGALFGGTLLAGVNLTGCSDSKPATAKAAAKGVVHQPGSGDAAALRPGESAPPLVDRLTVTVVVDSYYDAITKSGKVGPVNVERSGLAHGADLPRQLKSEWGLGLHLQSARADETRNYLLDFGLSPTAGLDNLEFLKVDLGAVDTLILSHGHYDHFGGLLEMLTKHRDKLRPDLTLYVGGEDTFCYRFRVPDAGEPQAFGVLDRRVLNDANVRVVMAETPQVIGGQAFTTGAIARNSFETVQPAHRVELGMRDGAGCDSSHFSPEEKAGAIVPDKFWYEHATCFNVKDRGLVIISSCGHAGIVNTIKAAQAASGVEKVHAVLGGFHLLPSPEPYVAQTVEAVKALNPDYIIPMHCTGQKFARLAEDAMPGRIIPSTTGTRFTFGAA